MEDTQQPTSAAPDQGASAPAPPTEREQQLDAQLKTVNKERDKLKNQVGTLTADRDSFKGKFEAADKARIAAETERDELRAKITEPTKPAEGEADEHAETRELLKRNGLDKAWILPSGQVCFQESHAKHVAGEGFGSLTVISAK